MTDMVGDHPLVSAAPLVGREREQAVLRDALMSALNGHGSLVLVGGEAGIGKTALAEVLCQEAMERGAFVLVGRCYDLSETPPYGPWAEALERTPRGEGVLSPPDVSTGSGAASQAALFAAVREYLGILAARCPLVLFLDDLHWADPATLDLLRYLARSLAALPILVLATYRDDEIGQGHPLVQRLPALVREARIEPFHLGALADDALRTLVQARYSLPVGDEARLLTYLRERAEGHPLFAAELLRTLEEHALLRAAAGGWRLGDLSDVPVPRLLRQVIAARLARLGGEQQTLLLAAAVLGQEVPFGLWTATSGADEAALLAVTERATAARLLDELPDGSGVCFAHALIREALYAGTPALRRRAIHRRAAEVLLATGDTDPDAVANHLERAGDPRASEWLVRAGERAYRAYAWLTAAARYEAALVLLEQRGGDPVERGWLRCRLALLYRYHDHPRGLAYLEAAIRDGEASGERALAAHAMLMRGMLRCLGGDVHAGLPEVQASVEAIEALSPSEQARIEARFGALGGSPVTSRGVLVMWLGEVGRYEEVCWMAEAVLARAAGAPPTRTRAASAVGDTCLSLLRAHAALGRPGAAHRAFAQARDEYRRAEHYQNLGRCAFHAMTALAIPYAGDDGAARRELAAEAEAAWRRASAGTEEAFPVRAAWLPLLALEGAWAEAEVLGAQVEGSWLEIHAAAVLGPLARKRDDRARAWALIGRWFPDGPSTPPGGIALLPALTLLRLAAALALDAGDLPAARPWLAAHDRWLTWSGAVLGRAEGQLGWAAYHRAADDLKAAHRHAETALAHASAPRQPLALLAAHRQLGELDLAHGRHLSAQAHLDVAKALASACAAPYERALTLLALAELRAAEGQRAEAVAALGEARATLEPLGARRALTRAQALAERPASPSPACPAALAARPFDLSAREVEVVRLVAAGRTDREIAGRLSLSARTVSNHLARIRAKTGAENRAALVALALRHGVA